MSCRATGMLLARKRNEKTKTSTKSKCTTAKQIHHMFSRRNSQSNIQTVEKQPITQSLFRTVYIISRI